VLGIEPARLAALGGRFRRLSFSGGRTAPPVPPTVAGSIRAARLEKERGDLELVELTGIEPARLAALGGPVPAALF